MISGVPAPETLQKRKPYLIALRQDIASPAGQAAAALPMTASRKCDVAMPHEISM
jgi:hypothetical protein